MLSNESRLLLSSVFTTQDLKIICEAPLLSSLDRVVPARELTAEQAPTNVCIRPDDVSAAWRDDGKLFATVSAIQPGEVLSLVQRRAGPTALNKVNPAVGTWQGAHRSRRQPHRILSSATPVCCLASGILLCCLLQVQASLISQSIYQPCQNQMSAGMPGI